MARRGSRLIVAALASATLATAVPALAAAPAPSAFTAKIEEAKSSMMADSAAALELAREARKLASSEAGQEDVARLTAQWLEGEALMRLNRGEEAADLLGKSLAEAERIAPRTKLHADLLRSHASVNAFGGNYGEALSSFLEAHERYQALGEARSEAIVLQNIGSLYSDARDYQRVLGYYRQARLAYPEDPALSLSAHNNTANALKELKKFDEAEAEFRKALEIAAKMDSPLLEARILTNIASTQYLRGQLGAAEATVVKGLAFAEKGAEPWEPFLYGVRAQIALARGNAKLAERYLQRTFAGQDLDATSPFFRDFHETAFTVYSALGQHQRASQHLVAFNRLDGQARDLSAKANNALLGARFDAANRELRISKLSAEKAANEVRLAKAQNQVWLLTGGIAFVILAFLAALATLRMMARSKAAISAANAKLTYVTQHDSLTGVFARDHFRHLLETEQRKAAAAGETGVLMFIDLDRFKQVNDLYGHATGDKLLALVAERFRAAAGKKAVIGRLGGDEFGVMLPSPTEMSEAREVAARLIGMIGQPYAIDDFEVSVGASVGLATIGETDGDTSTLMTNADLALYEAKRRGRATSAIYKPHMRDKLEERAILENDLAAALEEGQLSISYQPIVNGTNREVVCYEALMRWNHPERGEISPSVFIPIAEEALLIEQLGAWMLRTACNEAVNWPENVRLTVNVSALQISNGAFLGTVVDALAKSGLAPQRLLLELTESVVLEMDEQLEQLLASLNRLGVTFALDDFGRGYSSLNYIEKMQFSMIKIDRDFVQSAASGSPKSEAIISAIVSLAKSLDIDVTAEGIEEEDQVRAMTKLGCSCFQGYHFGQPNPAANKAKRSDRDEGPAHKVA
ncbi:EAL domain-containing protein [Sphingomicrobium lutaoense]|uniref:Diguanylate cyclase (GGDEF)-like protein n=1 Tax=Sphingomicrobium lutaoense TaxID=515949 RepID=A0A839YYH5_9SPHN|nr:EAL domain-containing protein [Sphingomicrobium lutaoense]MBB3763530.1 diguanylate cyclase (GGDEF)-like protein [Sphingomicrobium lutaoense]